jgi:RNA polymerase sigma factor (sigma-70 family)
LDINDWITQNYKHLKTTANNITGRDQLANDLLSESILILMEKPNVQEIVDSGGALWYLVRIMMNQFRSSTSPFHKTYRSTVELHEHYDAPEEFEEDHSELGNAMYKELQGMHWYGQKLFELHYIQGESISKISRETKIPRSSITLELKRVREHLRNKAEEHLRNDF